MIPRLIQDLFNEGYYGLAHEILTLSAPGTNFNKLFGTSWASLAKHSREYTSFERLKEQFRQTIEKRNIDGANKCFLSILRECPNYSTGADLENLLHQLWRCITDQLERQSGEILFLVKAVPFIHNQDIRKKFPEFCVEKHIELLEKIPSLTCKIRPDTITEFLTDSLKDFSSLVQNDQIPLYSSRIINFIHFATPVLLQPNSQQLMSLIKAKFTHILKGNANDKNLQLNFLFQMNILLNLKEFRANIDLDPDTRQLLMSVILHAFDDKFKKNQSPEYPIGPSSSTQIFEWTPPNPIQSNQPALLSESNFKILLIMAKKLHESKAIPLTSTVMIAFCNESYRLNQLDSGNYWRDRLIEKFDQSSPQEQKRILKHFPTWLTALHNGKQYDNLINLLELYLKLNGPTWPLENLFSEAFVTSQQTALVPFFLNHSTQKLFSTNTANVNHIAKWLLNALLLEKSIKQSQIKQFLNFLSREQIAGAEIWKNAYTQLLKKCTDPILQEAFETLRIAIKKGLLNDDDVCRITCWEFILEKQTNINSELQKEWLQDNTELQYIYRYNSGHFDTRLIRSLFNFIESHFGESSLPLPPEEVALLQRIQHQLKELFPVNSTEIIFWAIDLAILGFTRPSLEPEDFEEKLMTILNNIRSQVITHFVVRSQTEEFRSIITVHLTTLIHLFGTLKPEWIYRLLQETYIQSLLKHNHSSMMTLLFIVSLEKVSQNTNAIDNNQAHSFTAIMSILDLFTPFIIKQTSITQSIFMSKSQECIVRYFKNTEDIQSTKTLVYRVCSITDPNDGSKQLLNTNIASALKTISSVKISNRYDAQIILANEIINKLITECEYNDFKHVDILINILKEFIFNPKDLPETIDSHRVCSDMLMNRFNTFYNNYVKVRGTSDFGVYENVEYLRGRVSFPNYIVHLSQHPNPYTVWRFLETMHQDADRVFNSLTPNQLTALMNNFLQHYLLKCKTLKKAYPTPPYADLFLAQKIEDYRLHNQDLYLVIGSYFLLRPLLIKCIKSGNPDLIDFSLSSCKSLYNYLMCNIGDDTKDISEIFLLLSALADIVNDFTENGVYCGDPTSYVVSCQGIHRAIPHTYDLKLLCVNLALGLTVLKHYKNDALVPLKKDMLKKMSIVEKEWSITPFEKFKSLITRGYEINQVISFWETWNEKYPGHKLVEEFLQFNRQHVVGSSQDQVD
jgi:hypothetical protein